MVGRVHTELLVSFAFEKLRLLDTMVWTDQGPSSYAFNPCKLAKMSRRPAPPPDFQGMKSFQADVIAEIEIARPGGWIQAGFCMPKSHGSRFVDAASGRELIDLVQLLTLSSRLALNQPVVSIVRKCGKRFINRAAKVKVANADVYSVQYAIFVRILRSGHGLAAFWTRYFFYRRRRASGRKRA